MIGKVCMELIHTFLYFVLCPSVRARGLLDSTECYKFIFKECSWPS